MITFLTIVHVLITILLIFLVLVQDSKGGGMGGLGGGGNANTILGATGATTLAAKFTRWTAVAFAISCISLAVITSKSNKSVVDNLPVRKASALAEPLNSSLPMPSGIANPASASKSLESESSEMSKTNSKTSDQNTVGNSTPKK